MAARYSHDNPPNRRLYFEKAHSDGGIKTYVGILARKDISKRVQLQHRTYNTKRGQNLDIILRSKFWPLFYIPTPEALLI